MQRIRTLWNRGLVGKAIVSLAGLVIICCVIGILVPRQPRQQGAAPEANATVAVVPTEPPTATAAPTETPEPTEVPTAAAGIPAHVKAYMAGLAPELDTIGTSLRELGTLLSDAKPADTNWKIDLAVQVVAIQQAHTKISGMKAPDEVADIHRAVLDATGDCDTSTRFLTSGIDDNNANDVRQAATYMRRCSEKIATASRQVDAYIAAHQ